MTNLLSIDNLSVCYEDGVPVLHGVSLSLGENEVLGLIGESGCGKTTLLRSILRILPAGAKVISGGVSYRNKPLLTLRRREMAALRGRRIAFIPQDVGAALNDMCRVKTHFYDLMRTRSDAKILELFERVHLPNGKAVLDSYPFELSGGMKQRVLMALALCLGPELLIADEPTSSIDAPLRRQVLDELLTLKKELGMSLLLITHSIRELQSVADRIAVMHQGRVVETAQAETLLASPQHAYTRLLLEHGAREVKGNVRHSRTEGYLQKLPERFSWQEKRALRCKPDGGTRRTGGTRGQKRLRKVYAGRHRAAAHFARFRAHPVFWR